LSTQDPRTSAAARRRAVAIAGHERDVPTIRAALADDEPDVRATALEALRRAGDLHPDDLAAACTDPSPAVRRRAAEVLAAAPAEARGEVSLLGLLADPDATVAEVAAWASGELDPPEAGAVQALAALATTHEDALVREAAVAALGAIGDEAGLPAILAAARDKPAVRRRAVIALAPFEGPEVDAALARALEDRERLVRQAAEDLS
jgi:HEAT repeat protein